MPKFRTARDAKLHIKTLRAGKPLLKTIISELADSMGQSTPEARGAFDKQREKFIKIRAKKLRHFRKITGISLKPGIAELTKNMNEAKTDADFNKYHAQRAKLLKKQRILRWNFLLSKYVALAKAGRGQFLSTRKTKFITGAKRYYEEAINLAANLGKNRLKRKLQTHLARLEKGMK